MSPASDVVPEEFSLVEVATFLLRHRRLFIRFLLVGGVVGGLTGLISTRQYTSESAFVPLTRDMSGGLSQLAGLAAGLGVELPQGSAWDSPDFYQGLLSNPQILAKAGMASYGALTDGKTLAEYYKVTSDRPGITELRIVQRLKGDIDVVLDSKTGTVSVSVHAPSAALAQALNAKLIGLLSDFNLTTRQSQARAEREFTAQRLSEVRDSLRAAEDRMQAFLNRNRAVQNSAELTFQQDRLARDLTLQQTLYTTLAQSYEKAKLDEVRDIPVLAPVLVPTLPARGDARGTVAKGILGAMLAGTLALLIALWREARVRVGEAQTGPLAELRDLLARAGAESSALWARIRRRGAVGATGP